MTDHLQPTETPVDPATVNLWDCNNGDIIEIESADGLSLVRGEVRHGDHLNFRLIVQPGNQWVSLDPDHHGTHDGSTVRLVSRAEPDPDPEQVEAIAGLLYEANGTPEAAEHWSRTPQLFPAAVFAKHLVRRGARVEAPHA